MNQTVSGSRRGLLVVALAMLTLVADGYDLFVYGLAVPELLNEPDWGLTKHGAGYIGSLTLIGMCTGLLVAGPLTDRIGRRNMMMIGVAWFSVGSLVCAFATSPEFFGAARAFTGIGLGGVVPCAIALTAEFAPRNRRQVYNGVMLGGSSVGAIAASLLALWLLPDLGWRSLFVVAFASLVLVPMMYFLLPESVNALIAHGRLDEAREVADRCGVDFEAGLREHDVHEARGAGRGYGLVLSPQFRTAAILFVLATFFAQLVIYGLGTWLAQIMRAAGYAQDSALQVTLALQIGAGTGMVVGSLFADRIGSKRVTVPLLVLGSLSLLALSIEMPFGLLMVVTCLAGIGSISTGTLLYGFIADYFPAAARGSAIGLAQGLGRFGGMLSPAIGGWIAGSGFAVQWNFYAFAIPPLLAATCLALIPRSKSADSVQLSKVLV
jgi:MFS transporter, AAHS family, benzoate transport protein